MALMLLLLLPFGASDHATALTLIYLTLPGYMLHQVEEHWGDRFRSYVNTRVFGGVEALTSEDVLWINLPGVWGLNLLSLYAGLLLGPGWGLSAIYLMLVNSLSHIVNAAVSRIYNPGLFTSIIVFLPLTIAALALTPARVPEHVFGLAVSLAVHGVIILRIVARARMLRRQRLVLDRSPLSGPGVMVEGGCRQL